MTSTDKVVKNQLMVLMLSNDDYVARDWQYYAADVVLVQTEVPDTFKILKNKVGPSGGLWRQVAE